MEQSVSTTARTAACADASSVSQAANSSERTTVQSAPSTETSASCVPAGTAPVSPGLARPGEERVQRQLRQLRPVVAGEDAALRRQTVPPRIEEIELHRVFRMHRRAVS